MTDRQHTNNNMALGIAGVVGAAVGVAATALLTDKTKREKVRGWLGGMQHRTKELATGALEAVGNATEKTKDAVSDRTRQGSNKVG